MVKADKLFPPFARVQLREEIMPRSLESIKMLDNNKPRAGQDEIQHRIICHRSDRQG